MKYYEHSFSSVEDYLHHRAPYLMVDRVVALGPTWVETEKSISGEEPFLAGHFPGAPVFPGAMMQEACTQSAGILIAAKFNPMEQFNTHDAFFNPYALGVLVRVKRAKYSGFARPGDILCVRVDLIECLGNVFQFDARISLNKRSIMRATFQLTNIPSATLSQPPLSEPQALAVVSSATLAKQVTMTDSGKPDRVTSPVGLPDPIARFDG